MQIKRGLRYAKEGVRKPACYPHPGHAEPDLAAHPLALRAVPSLECQPVAVYLAHLAPTTRRVMRGALDAIAGILTAGRCDAFALDWAALRYQHTAAVRAVLADGR